MRKIKFRGKRKDTNEWIYGDLVHNGINGSSRIIPVGIAVSGCFPIEVITETVGEYTGLRDKNGKEIWEGDIVDNIIILGDSFKKSSVTFKDGCFGLFISIKNGKHQYEPCLYEVDDRFIEVIGNRFENPELLES